MKIFRFESTTGNTLYGTGDGDEKQVLSGDILTGLKPTGETAKVARLLSPIDARALLCIGLNYRQHAAETGAAIPAFPVLFFKNPAAVHHPNAPVLIPRYLRSEQVDYECELAVIIGKAAKNVPRAKALDYVLGYTCANDVSARDWQLGGGGNQWNRGKSFDTFCPLGPCLVTADDIPNPNALRISTRVGDETLQDSNTADMIFDVPTIIEFLSASTTLLPGTVIITGTPQGVGMARTPKRWLQPGEIVTVEIEKIGALSNPMAEEVADGTCSFQLPRS
jgi:2-keto-4-pentenoate hydratase/2-oxohepta-3-ene-1,7-dioic acid hydratase in catechol pathway